MALAASKGITMLYMIREMMMSMSEVLYLSS